MCCWIISTHVSLYAVYGIVLIQPRKGLNTALLIVCWSIERDFHYRVLINRTRLALLCVDQSSETCMEISTTGSWWALWFSPMFLRLTMQMLPSNSWFGFVVPFKNERIQGSLWAVRWLLSSASRNHVTPVPFLPHRRLPTDLTIRLRHRHEKDILLQIAARHKCPPPPL